MAQALQLAVSRLFSTLAFQSGRRPFGTDCNWGRHLSSMETWFGPQPQPIGRVKKPGTVPSAVHGCGVLSMTYEGRGDCTQGFFTHLIDPAANVTGRLAAESLNSTTRVRVVPSRARRHARRAKVAVECDLPLANLLKMNTLLRGARRLPCPPK